MFARGLSAAWLAPLAALALAGGLAWRHYAARGPEITILFESGEGLEAGRTPIRFRDVQIGVIEALAFTEDLSAVVAEARLDASVAHRLTEGARFWVVRAQVDPSGVRGLGTLISGAYVEADLGPPEAEPQERYVALDEAPLIAPQQPGARVTLRSESGAWVIAGSPLIYQGVEVGLLERRTVSEDGRALLFDAFIQAPYDRMIGPGTRFWNVSGVEASISAEGAEIEIGSFLSILRGGVAFDRLMEMEGPPREIYTLYDSRRDAQESLFGEEPGEALRLSVAFEGAVGGLSAGASVEYRGVEIGEVEDIAIQPGSTLDQLDIVAALRLQPGRLGLEGEEALEFFRRSVERGLRARLASANLLTGALYVQLVDAPDAEPAMLDLDAEPYPRLPTTPSTLDALRRSGQDLLARVAELPLEALLTEAVAVLDNIERLTGDERLQAVPQLAGTVLEQAAAAAADVRELVGDERLQAAPERVAEVLDQAAAAVGNLERLTADEALQAAPARAAAALEEAAAAAADLRRLIADEALQGAPAQVAALLETAAEAIGNVERLTADEALRDAPAQATALLEQAAATLRNVERLTADESLQAAPERVVAVLAEVETLLGELREAGVAASLNQTLASAEAAAGSFQQAAESLPAAVRQLAAAAAEAERQVSQLQAGAVSNEAVAALREVRTAARALSRLAQTLERQPNSLILGR
jgi:paraquat-inducible protein B